MKPRKTKPGPQGRIRWRKDVAHVRPRPGMTLGVAWAIVLAALAGR
jgi:hypothetical protein